MRKYFNALLGLLLIPFRVKYFVPQRVFKDKRVAIVGPADSAFVNENGSIIDRYDYVIRINKALVTWNAQNEKYIGTKTDILFHNFHENMDSGGGGPLDSSLYKKVSLKYLIQPRFDSDGWRSIFNYFKKYLLVGQVVSILPYRYYKKITDMFAEYHPTKGFCALYSVMNSPCDVILITGFTFFRTPYGVGYRDNIRNVEATQSYIKSQALHDTDLEFKNFIKLLGDTTVQTIYVDQVLYDIIYSEHADLATRVRVIHAANSK